MTTTGEVMVISVILYSEKQTAQYQEVLLLIRLIMQCWNVPTTHMVKPELMEPSIKPFS